MNKPKILTIIPARKGSKGIPSKNKKKILGKPLVGYSFEIASNLPDNYYAYVSSDDHEIIELAKEYKIKSNGIRPANLSSDNALTLDVLKYELDFVEKNDNIDFDAVLLLQPTCPIRKLDHIKEIEDIFIKNRMMCSVVSIKKIGSEHPFRMKVLSNDNNQITNYIDQGFEDMRPRQELPPVFIRNGSIYLTPAASIRKNISMVTDVAFGFEMDEKFSVNIDVYQDFLIAKYYLEAEAGIEPA
ncbi:acylneuraminate cytidylyltransferase family protein [Gammaproteobacteria bacterium]|nr:acylneuraminate cytidylyltransferase family protein [Gammaproteobacteria bacterium]